MANTTSVADAMLASAKLCAAPSGAMLFMALASYFVTVPAKGVAALQHFAAGIVLSAVAVELVPIISAAPRDAATTCAIAAGFLIGIAIFLLLGKFCGVEHEDHEEQHQSSPPSAVVPAPPVFSTPNPSSSGPLLEQESTRPSLVKRQQSKLTQMRQSRVKPHPPYPTTLAFAVFTDSCVDGLLVGLASASGSNAGLVIAIALAIEMGFLERLRGICRSVG